MNETFNVSAGGVPPLTQGDTINMLSSLNPAASARSPDSERLMAIMSGISDAADTDDLDQIDLLGEEDDDDEADIDLAQPSSYEQAATPIARSSPRISRSPAPPDTAPAPAHAPAGTTEDMDADVSRETEETEDDRTETSHKKYIIAGLILVVIVVITLIVKSATASKKQEEVSQPMAQPETPVVSDEQKFYADVIELSDQVVYQDTMTIDKYIVLTKDSCQYVFEGYAENARAFVQTEVDLDTYNLYKKGARVQITYRHINLNDKEYYIEVEVHHE